MPTPYSMGSNDSASTASLVVAVSVTTSAGDVIAVAAWSAQPVTRVTDTQGNSYVLARAAGGASFWVTTGKTNVLTSGTDTVTITLSSAGAANAKLIGVPGVHYAGLDSHNSATGTGTSVSLGTGNLTTSSGEIALALVANTTSGPTWSGAFVALGTVVHNLSPEFLGAGWASITSAATATATITSGTWAALVITLQITSFVGSVPGPPTQYAGQLATSTDMNALANSALFWRRPPMVIAQATTGQSLTGGVQAAVQYSALLRDTDGFFSTAFPTRLTVQTPGIYKVRYSIPFGVAGVSCQVLVRIQTGANNPAGAGVQTPFWYGFASAAGGIDGTVNGGGVMPVYFYAQDFIQIMATVATTSTMPTSPQAALVSMRMVSV